MNYRLFKVTQEWNELSEYISSAIDEEGAVPPDLEDSIKRYFEINNEERPRIIRELASDIIELKSIISRRKDEIARQKTKIASHEKNIKRLELYIETLLSEGERVEGERLKIYRGGPSSIDILEPSLIPERYFKTKKEKYISKTLIKEDLEQGIDIPGISLIKEKLKIRFS